MFSVTAVLIWIGLVLPSIYFLFNFTVFYWDVRRRAKHINLFPGDPPHFIWGHIHEFPGPGETGLKWLRERASRYTEGVQKAWFGHFTPTVQVYDPEAAKVILKTAEPKPPQFGGYRLLKPWLGNGLLVSGGSKWARNRRLLTPAFHFDILKSYMIINNKCTQVFLDKLARWSTSNKHFDMLTHISLLTLDVILRCAFSYDNDCQVRGETHPYVKSVNVLQEIVVDRILRPWLYPDVIFNLTSKGRQFRHYCDYVHSVSEKLIKTRKMILDSNSEYNKGKSQHCDFLDILLMARDEDEHGLSELEIRDEVDTFLFEGHDTTASGISWTLYDLACHPDIQRRCQQEVDALLEGRDSDEILWEDLAHLKYITLCIKESLRLHTPVPFIERQTTSDMEIKGHFLPAGTIVDIQLYLLHHNPNVWDNPADYQPERFLPENIEQKDNYAFVPFSAGPR
ncbi:hypothetical protein LSH36_12g34012 [Paralvinella palmiformis]|uniref:Cytochrome P450 n=1 Tax=Paralvinella palmiformis TaxID=53620 RepID=A0AAD9NHX2_9ANNE|nr:hypothetical protein LSH36_12g34012 [Paralvinella palmiformis]